MSKKTTKPTIVDKHGNKLSAHDWLAYCCGARATKASPRKETLEGRHKGIRVWPGKSNNQFDNGKNLVTTVNTKNGPLSIGIRYVW